MDTPEQVPVKQRHVVGQLLHAEQLQVNLDRLRGSLLLRQGRLQQTCHSVLAFRNSNQGRCALRGAARSPVTPAHQGVDVLARRDEETCVEAAEAGGDGQVVVRDDDALPGRPHLHEHQVLGGAQLELVRGRQLDVLGRGRHRAAQRAVCVVRAVHAEDDCGEARV